MSSRALRKLQGPNLLEIASDDVEEEDLLVTSQNSGTKKKINAFNVLVDSNDDEEDHASSDEEQISKDCQQENLDEKENVNASGNKSSNQSRRKGKKKKKRGKKFEEDDLKKDEDDEFLLLNTSNSSISTGQPSSSLTDGSMFTKPLLMVEHRNLNAENELCRKFGTKIVKGDRGRSNHRRIHRSTFLVKPRDNWPKVGKSGIQMKMTSSNNGYTYFTFEHTPSYQAIQFRFWDAVESMDPSNISGVLGIHGYHIDSLLQLSEVCKMGEDHQMAAELVERALFCFECSFHPLFNITQGKSRIEYRNAENRPFFLALFQHIKFVGQKGCYRTALELCKLLLSLSPDEDPLCVLLMIDFYALHSGEYDFLIRLYDEWQIDKNLSQLPNFAFSAALAHFLRSKDSGSLGTANEMIQTALINFPATLIPLLDKCSITMETKMMSHPFFTIGSHGNEAIGLKQLIALYVGRTFTEWKDPEVVDWLAQNVKIVLERVDRQDPFVKECAQKRRTRYQGTPRNVYRHIILSDIKEASTSLPLEMSASPVMSYDPLPPVDSVAGYERPKRIRLAPQHNHMAEFFRSLWPSYSLQPNNGQLDFGDNDDHVEIEGAQGDTRGNLTRGVEHVMTAMRELLNTMTYRGDIEDGRGDEERGEDENGVG